MTLPNFLVIGAQKSGTTWLHRFLGSRADIHVPTATKELKFFDHEERFPALGVAGYQAFFADAGPATAVGEVTPGYLWVSSRHAEWGAATPFRQGTPGRVREILGPDVKLVVVLRNPIDRALSGFMHHRRMGRIGATESLRDYSASYGIVHLGFYAAHLSCWEAYFPRRNFYVTTYEALFSDHGERGQILRFLGCNDDAGDGSADSLINTRFNQGLGFVRNRFGAFDSNNHCFADTEAISTLREAYSPDVAALSSWLDVSRWRSDFG